MGYGGKPAHIASEVSAHFATGICRLKPAHIASEVSAHFAKGGSRRILQTANPNPAHFANIPYPPPIRFGTPPFQHSLNISSTISIQVNLSAVSESP